MLNQYPLWKYLLLLAVLLLGLLYAAPNIYGEDPSVLVSHRNKVIETAQADKLIKELKPQVTGMKSYEVTNGKLLIRFNSEEDQLTGLDKVKALPEVQADSSYTVALNLSPATPAWLQALNASPMYLGLDLRGGVHFLMEVDMNAAIQRLEETTVSDMRTFLRGEKIRYLGIKREKDAIIIKFKDLDNLDKGEAALKREFRDLDYTSDEDAHSVTARLTDKAIREEKKFAVQQNVTTLRNRVNELGVAEPVIQQQGDSRIVVQLPGVQDTDRAKDILGATATLEFRLAEGTRADWFDAEKSGHVPLSARLYHERDGSPVLLKRRVIVTGDQINNAAATIDKSSGTPAVSVTLDGKGAKKMGKITRENINKPMAVVFIENKTITRYEGEKKITKSVRKEEVINVATIRDAFSKNFQITGLQSTEAHDLALLLRAGSLRAPVQIVEERTVGPSLGKDNIKKGFESVVVGFTLVLVFMVLYYKVFGLIADLALTFNLVLIFAILSLFQATLTMPGIAGIVLTVGMAVDANVLIYERIREELRNGNSPQASIHAGYEKAFSTIADANITTLIAGVVLFSFGTGPVKGFAITLTIGILTSMFTAIMGTRALVNLLYGRKQIKQLPI